jgi:hypothetical protein
MGFPHEEAVRHAARNHAAYSEISQKYRQKAGKILFVPSFRVLMPERIVRAFMIEPVQALIEAAKGEKVPAWKLKALLKSLAFLSIPIGINEYMKARGWKVDKATWKWYKEIEVDGKAKEMVVSMNYIINMPFKWGHRLFGSYSPFAKFPGTRWFMPRAIQGLYQLMKWEIHPLWRAMHDIVINRKAMGGGRIYDPSEPDAWWDAVKYFFGTSFRIWNFIAEDIDLAEPTREKEREYMLEAMNDFERFVFGNKVFGYAYLRQSKDKWIDGLNVQLKLEYGQRKNEIRYLSNKHNWSQEYKKKKKAVLKAWVKRTQEWIDDKKKELDKNKEETEE